MKVATLAMSVQFNPVKILFKTKYLIFFLKKFYINHGLLVQPKNEENLKSYKKGQNCEIKKGALGDTWGQN
jgi:hypothetical protein